MSPSLYEQLGVRRVVNATGNVTMLGGSTLSPRVLEAIEESNQMHVAMEELLDKSGQAIAGMLGVEYACVTSGCYAALVTGIAGLMTGHDPAKIGALPDTTGMRNEIIMQKRMRYHYDRCVTTPGGRLIEAGDANGTTAAQLAAAIGPQTAGILHFARADGAPGTVPLAEVIEIAHSRGTRVIVDAAGEVYPLQHMAGIAQSGADLICFGAKYIGAGNSTGFLCGKRDAVEAAKLNGFISYEAQRNRAIGRGYKLDRQEIVAVTVALQEWLELDHEERLHTQAQRIETIRQGLAGLPGVLAETMWDDERAAWMRLRVEVDPAQGKEPAAVQAALRAGDPSIWVRVENGSLYVEVHALKEGEDALVAERLAAALR